ncbi:Chaperone J-domain superfamily [Arabidopsis thaliana x Arabidopsis arenosa]|uniref:Chaperone J-domain superfamily n=1 Tax=Arabidopsis thaliana x Arabidopsis arenosa TaxID=1240361 RepID=A0A8T1YYU9_9BRAS|nr:Chaperone J-domain superfamily [Arabidopsis thaliana x Arabidopsis arenosa]
MEDNDKSPPKDYYKILEVDYDATEELIRLNYRKLALKWHPDKHKGDSAATEKFQEINEAYNVLMDPAKRFEYDFTGIYEIHKYTLREYLARFKGMILTCNGLGISQSSSPWTHQLAETTKQQTSKVGFLFLFSLCGIAN